MMNKSKKLTLLMLIAIIGLFAANSSLVYAVATPPPPGLPLPSFEDDDTDFGPNPSLELADDEVVITPEPDPTPDPIEEPVHSSATLPKNGPGEIALLTLVAISLAGGYTYRLKKEKN